MLKKIILSIVLLVFCFSSSFAVNGFFFEGGIGSRYINGDIEYDKFVTIHYKESVTDINSLNWNSKFLGNYNATIGFRVYQKLVTLFSIQYVHDKAGFSTGSSNSFQNINTELGENIQRNSLSLKKEKNWFSQINLRATQSVYVNSSLFLIAGVEYSSLNLEMPPRYNLSQTKYKVNTFGAVTGFGYELTLSSKMSLVTTGMYVFSSYKGNGLYYSNFEFDLGGLELGYTLRYYLK